MNQKIVIQDSDLHCGKKWDKPNKATEWIIEQKNDYFVIKDCIIIEKSIISEKQKKAIFEILWYNI